MDKGDEHFIMVNSRINNLIVSVDNLVKRIAYLEDEMHGIKLRLPKDKSLDEY